MPPQQAPKYDFILAPQTPQRSGPAFLQNPRQRNIIVGLFLATVLTIVLVVASLLFSGGGGNQDMVVLAAHQTELVRVANIGLEQAKGSEARQLAATVSAVATSDLQSTQGYLSRNGTKLSTEQLAARQQTTTTDKLTSAAQRTDYDDIFLSVMDELIAAYSRDLQTSLTNATGNSKRAVVETAAQNVLTITTEE